MMTNHISIVIVSYNTKALLVKCLDLLGNDKTLNGCEVIVVDNASTDGSALAVEKLYKEVCLVKNTRNLLFAKACNQGVEMANKKHVLLLNSDTFPKDGEIEKLSKWLSTSDQKVACVGPRVINVNKVLQSEGHPFSTINLTISNVLAISKWPVPKRIKTFLLPEGYHWFRYGETRQVNWISGAAMLIKKNVWEVIGGLDDELYYYNEDIEWCYRAKRKGYETWVFPEAEIMHIGGASSKKRTDIKWKFGLLRGEKYFYKVTQGKSYHLLNNILILALYPIPYLVCKLLKMEYYRQAAGRSMEKAINTIKIITYEYL